MESILFMVLIVFIAPLVMYLLLWPISLITALIFFAYYWEKMEYSAKESLWKGIKYSFYTVTGIGILVVSIFTINHFSRTNATW